MKVCILIAVLIIILYLLAIMPRMLKKPNRAPFMKAMYAHRGMHNREAGIPENSMAAFRKAIEGGYGIELDVQLSKDKVPIIFHDFTLDRICGVKGKVADYTYEELQQFRLCGTEEKIPRLKEFLETVSGRVPLIIEYKVEWKDVTVCRIVDKMLREYKGDYCIESFNPLALLWYRKNHNSIMRGQLSDDFRREGKIRALLYLALTYLLLNFMTKPDFIAYHYKYYKNISRCLCHGLYKNTAVAWTIKGQEELECSKPHFELFIFEGFEPKNSFYD